MPISQDRMLALLRAAQDYQQALAQLTANLARTEARVQSGQITPAEAWPIAAASTMALLLLSDPVNSPQVIAAEAIHFKNNYKRNARKAQKSRENRRAAELGIPRPTRGPTTAPTTMVKSWLGPATSHQPVTAISAEPEVHMLSKSTDHLQIQSDSELDFTASSEASEAEGEAMAETIRQLEARLTPEQQEAIRQELEEK